MSRREARSAAGRAARAGLLPLMWLDTWTEPPDLVHDRQLLSDLTTLRFVDAGHSLLILGAVGKSHLATALGHIAVRHSYTVQMIRAGKLFTRLRGARLDQTLEAEFCRLTRLDLIIIDDFALKILDATTTVDSYELCVEQHARAAATVATSNRDPRRMAHDDRRPTTGPVRGRSAHRTRAHPDPGRTVLPPTPPLIDARPGQPPCSTRPRGVVPWSWQRAGPFTLASDTGTPTGQGIVHGNSLACYVQGDSGRKFVVMIAMDNMPFDTFEQFLTVTQDQAEAVAAMQAAF